MTKILLAITLASVSLSGSAFAESSAAWATLNSGNLWSGACGAAEDLAMQDAKKTCLNKGKALVSDYIVDDCEDRVVDQSYNDNIQAPGVTTTITSTYRKRVKYVAVTYRCE